MIMADYIEREDAIKAAKHAWAKGLEPSQYMEIIPSAEVVPVRHGRWLKSREPLGWNEVDCVACTACGESWILSEDDGLCDIEWDYCPNCGCLMDGGTDE